MESTASAVETIGISVEVLDAIEEVVMGCVLSAGVGQAPARQVLRGAGVPDAVVHPRVPPPLSASW